MSKPEFVEIEVVSNNTERTVLTFQEKAENAISKGYDRVAKFLKIDNATAHMNYHVNVKR